MSDRSFDAEERERRRRLEEYGAKLAQHKRRFRCHVCGKESTGPKEYFDGPGGRFSGRNWNEPKNLVRCRRCSKWTCHDHIIDGVCTKHKRR